MKLTRLISSSIIVVMFCLAANNMYQLVNYAVNFDSISQELCENKDSDIVECNGMCYLADQIVEVKGNSDDFTMTHVQLNQWNMNFLFYFFQDVEELNFKDYKEGAFYAFVINKTQIGFAKLNVPPPEFIS